MTEESKKINPVERYPMVNGPVLRRRIDCSPAELYGAGVQ